MTQTQFDSHQFETKRARPVNVTKTADGWDSTGISFDDYARMQCPRSNTRRYYVPDWAIDDLKVRSVIRERITRYCYAQGIVVPGDASAGQLHELAMQARAKYGTRVDDILPERFETVEACDRQKHVKEQHFTVTSQGVPGYLARLIYCAYRMGLNSVEICEAMGMRATPIQVRQSLHRLNLCAHVLFSEKLEDALKSFNRTKDFPPNPDSAFDLLDDGEPSTAEKLSRVWDEVQCANLESGRLAVALTSFAMRVGSLEAVKTIQRVVGVKADGTMGDVTLVRLNVEPKEQFKILKAFLNVVEAHYRTVATRSDVDARNVKIWLAQLASVLS